MKLEYDSNGNIKINIFTLIDNLQEAAKLDFIESLSCHDVVIKHVVDQLFDGWTENGFHGGGGISGAYSSPYATINKARREISKRSSDRARKEIEELEEALGKAEKEVKSLSDRYWDLYHSRYDKT